jgi:hypothetical protein
LKRKKDTNNKGQYFVSPPGPSLQHSLISSKLQERLARERPAKKREKKKQKRFSTAIQSRGAIWEFQQQGMMPREPTEE